MKNKIVAQNLQRKIKSLQNDCNESIIKKKGAESDERKQAFRI